MNTLTPTAALPQGNRALAFIAGCVFLAGTCAILFEDVILGGAALTLKHAITVCVLSGTILAGHLAKDAQRARHRLAAAGFALVFVAGTALVVYSSVGRQAAGTIQTAAEIDDAAGRRVEIKAARTRSESMLTTAQRELADECKTGKGKRCDGIRATIEVYTAAIKGHDAALDKLGPPRVPSPDAEQFAEVLHVVFGADKARIKAGTVLVAPFLIALFLELGTVIAFGFTFRHAPVRDMGNHISAEPERTWQTDYPADAADADLSNVIALFGDLPDDGAGPSGGSSGPDRPVPKGPKNGPKSPDGRKDDVAAAIITALACGRTFPRQADLCERFGVPRSTMSDWLTEWEAAGLIPVRRTVGRCKALAG